jgi:tRNA(fMet)-specific endonuclease VapC
MKKILLDTNAYSAFMNGDEDVLSALGAAEVVYLSVFVLGELLTGFAGGRKEQENLRLLEQFKSRSTVKILNATEETSEIFASIKHSLAKAGTPIPINDIWIASHAIETGSLLVTKDGHFKTVPGLRILNLEKSRDNG